MDKQRQWTREPDNVPITTSSQYIIMSRVLFVDVLNACLLTMED